MTERILKITPQSTRSPPPLNCRTTTQALCAAFAPSASTAPLTATTAPVRTETSRTSVSSVKNVLPATSAPSCVIQFALQVVLSTKSPAPCFRLFPLCSERPGGGAVRHRSSVASGLSVRDVFTCNTKRQHQLQLVK